MTLHNAYGLNYSYSCVDTSHSCHYTWQTTRLAATLEYAQPSLPSNKNYPRKKIQLVLKRSRSPFLVELSLLRGIPEVFTAHLLCHRLIGAPSLCSAERWQGIITSLSTFHHQRRLVVALVISVIALLVYINSSIFKIHLFAAAP